MIQSNGFGLVQTCEAFPSQWQGQDAEGFWTYLRYRNGDVQIGFGPTVEDAIHAAMAQECYYTSTPDDPDGGHMLWPEMEQHFALAVGMMRRGSRYG